MHWMFRERRGGDGEVGDDASEEVFSGDVSHGAAGLGGLGVGRNDGENGESGAGVSRDGGRTKGNEEGSFQGCADCDGYGVGSCDSQGGSGGGNGNVRGANGGGADDDLGGARRSGTDGGSAGAGWIGGQRRVASARNTSWQPVLCDCKLECKETTVTEKVSTHCEYLLRRY